jgi:transketolase
VHIKKIAFPKNKSMRMPIFGFYNRCMLFQSENDFEKLRNISKEIRKDIILSLTEAGSGHLGASLGLADVFTFLYFSHMRHKPHDPEWAERDRLILSIGHVAPVLYATLAHCGYFPRKELMTLRKMGSRLQGHPGREHKLPGIELSAGSLGQGLSVAVGRALTAKTDKKNWRVFSIHGDGELQEGSIWEAAMSAAHYSLDNLCALVDRNRVQIDGNTEDVMALEPLKDKWQAFGWHVLECNGHDFEELKTCFAKAEETKKRPSVILAETKMGKGVKSIENNHLWHGKAPDTEQSLAFLKELLNNK